MRTADRAAQRGVTRREAGQVGHARVVGDAGLEIRRVVRGGRRRRRARSERGGGEEDTEAVGPASAYCYFAAE
jgi:hypothetical protein